MKKNPVLSMDKKQLELIVKEGEGLTIEFKKKVQERNNHDK